MKLYALLLLAHMLGVIVWVGGMWVMHFAVRPAAVAQLAPPQRLPLLAAVLRRFLLWVDVAVLLVLAGGFGMIWDAGGFRGVHASVHTMTALGLVMTAVFVWVRAALYPRLARAVAAADWPAAGRALEPVRRAVALNLALGILTTAVAIVGRSF